MCSTKKNMSRPESCVSNFGPRPKLLLKADHPRRNFSNLLIISSLLLMASTWIALVLIQPAQDNWNSLANGTGGALALFGFGIGTCFAVFGILPSLKMRTIVLIPVMLVVNIVLGQVIGTLPLPIPLYLDSLGTVLIAALSGPGAGMVTGALSGILWGLVNPTVVPFLGVYASIGLLAGYAPWVAKRRFIIGYGALIGVFSALVSAPIAAFIFGGTAGTGTGLVVTAFRSLGFTPLQSVYLQSLVSDPVDKMIIFALVLVILAALPERIRAIFRPHVSSSSAQN